MASILYTGIVSGLKGSIHGSTFQGGYASPIIRGKTNFNRNFIRTLSFRDNSTNHNFMASVAQTWRTLSPTQQTAYAAVTASFPFKNKFGAAYTPSAYQLFCWQNLNLLSCGGDIITTPPTVVLFPSLAGLSLDVETGYTFTASWDTILPTGFYLQAYVSYGMSAGITSAKNKLKYIGVFNRTGLNELAGYGLYVSKFQVPVVGLQYFIALKMVSVGIGSASEFSYASTIST